jgi:hypothetical protein
MRSMPKEFPNALCWTPHMRAEVMNTIALDVDKDIFKATHYPSFVQQEGSRRGTFVPLQEELFLRDFLDENHSHVFDIAVGDTGTGKSHLIRWMYNEIHRVSHADHGPYWLVIVPRSSTNLADVVQRIIQGFHGEVATRLAEELNRHHKLPLDEAKNRVIDELAYVLEAGGPQLFPANHHPTPEEEQILKDLPALLRAQELRKVLLSHSEGVVTRVARHVLGRRETRDKDADLKWVQTDLTFTAVQSRRAGAEAEELALMLFNDDRACKAAVNLVNRAQPMALTKLLRFRSGDMKAALAEIRRELLQRRKELILLIEDLSVTEGLDGELIEALQVRTRDTGEELCRLRSIVGVTNDDYARMRENIAEGRTLRTLFFNMTFGGGKAGGSVSTETLLDFASRYLNTTRHSIEELRTWSAHQPNEPLPSFCDNCINRSSCHEAFGAIDGRGLYPLSTESLPRLYERVSTARGQEHKAFNPRLLVGRVLNSVLVEAEQSLESNEFPRASLTASFALDWVRADVQLDLRQQFGAAAERVQRAIDLYSPDPSSEQPALATGIAKTFNLPVPRWTTHSPKPTAAPVAPSKPSPSAPSPSELDPFDRWLRGEALADRELNQWRVVVHAAIQAWIDWDTSGLASVKSRFKSACIQFEGQFTKQKTDFSLLISRQPETAITLRGLFRRFQGKNRQESEREIGCARRQIHCWSEKVTTELRGMLLEPGEPPPVVLAAELLALGAVVRGIAPSRTDAEILCGALTPWPEELPGGRSDAWLALWKAYKKSFAEVRDILVGNLACSKGGQIGAILDPSSVLPALRYVFKHGRAHSRPKESDHWIHHETIASLAKEVETHLGVAVSSESKASEQWIHLVENSLGGTEPKDLVATIRGALEVAGEVGGVRMAGVQNFEARLTDLKNKPITKCFKDAQRAVASDNPADQIAYLGILDRGLMIELEKFLVDADKVLAASTEHIQATMLQIGHGSAPSDLEAEIRSLLENIVSRLNVIAGEL